MQRTTALGYLASIATHTAQLLYLRFKEHQGRGSGKIVRDGEPRHLLSGSVSSKDREPASIYNLNKLALKQVLR